MLVGLPSVALLLLLVIGLVKCSKNPKCSCILKIVEKIQNKVMFSMPLRTCITSYIGLCIASGLGRGLNSAKGEIEFNAPILGIVLAILLGTTYFVRYIERERFEDEDFITKYATLYQGLRPKH